MESRPSGEGGSSSSRGPEPAAAPHPEPKGSSSSSRGPEPVAAPHPEPPAGAIPPEYKPEEYGKTWLMTKQNKIIKKGPKMAQSTWDHYLKIHHYKPKN